MAAFRSRPNDDVDQLLRNAELRTALEPYMDEAVMRVDPTILTTQQENEFLSCMLEWEKAPIIPISQWFEPELSLPPPGPMNDDELRKLLWETIQQLYAKQIVLDFTDHLNDRELYQLIRRDILPSAEKKCCIPGHYLHWDCAGSEDDQQAWLQFYADDDEREMWSESTGQPLPPRQTPPYPRDLPSARF